jgi:NAD(P)-dependent dehydrogenase (short-subunit alcohol dehydrogenase family)
LPFANAKLWLVTGIARGFGKQLSEELLKNGHHVAGTTRNGLSDLRHENLTVFKLDVTNPEDVHAAVLDIIETVGPIDVVVNNAGFGMVGAVEEVSPDEARHVFATNVFGTLNVIQAVLPSLRKQRSGLIINFSSVGGMAGSAGFGIYNATKFAVEGMSEALALEVNPFGIRVMIVEPGYFRTEFLSSQSMSKAKHVIEDYAPTAGVTRANVGNRDGSQPGDPAKAVRVIIAAAESEHPPLRLPLGADAFARIDEKIAKVRADMAAWRELATATSF